MYVLILNLVTSAKGKVINLPSQTQYGIAKGMKSIKHDSLAIKTCDKKKKNYYYCSTPGIQEYSNIFSGPVTRAVVRLLILVCNLGSKLKR